MYGRGGFLARFLRPFAQTPFDLHSISIKPPYAYAKMRADPVKGTGRTGPKEDKEPYVS